MRIFIDTSVFVAACASQIGGSHYLFAIARKDPTIQLVTNSYAMVEAKRNCLEKLPQAVDQLIELTTSKELLVMRESPPALVRLAAHIINLKDAPILAGALYARADILCTLDKKDFHMPKIATWGSHFGLKILYPRDVIYRWKKQSRRKW